MRVVFMGTPDFAARILEKISEKHVVAGVFTRPDAVRGRGKSLVPSPVKVVAEKIGAPVYTPKTLRDEEAERALAALEPDVICVAAYSLMIPKSVLEMPKHGCLNVHASLLPRWRGAAPIERAILAGDEYAGVCIMHMEESLDTGDYCRCIPVLVANKGAGALTEELADEGAQALLDVLHDIEQGKPLSWEKQDNALATYAQKLFKGELNPIASDTAEQALRKVRASSDSHTASIVLAGKSIGILEAELAAQEQEEQLENLQAGEARFLRKMLFVKFEQGLLRLVRVKPAGKNEMDAAAFAAGIQGSKTNVLTWESIDA